MLNLLKKKSIFLFLSWYPVYFHLHWQLNHHVYDALTTSSKVEAIWQPDAEQTWDEIFIRSAAV